MSDVSTGVMIVVNSNGELFKNGLNAVAAIFGSSFFPTATRLSALFAIFGMAFHYIQSQDIKVFARWFVLYFFVTTLLFGIKVTVNIRDVSQPPPGSAFVVDHIPIGLAYPASFITTLSYHITEEMEKVFHDPNDIEYNRTGTLFGSKLFALSSQSHFIDPELNAAFNRYFENCVVGDIYINHKYSLKDLQQSNDLWETISQKPSPLRRILYQDELMTCSDATPKLKKAIEDDVSLNLASFATLFLGGSVDGKDETEKNITLMKGYLTSAYNYYANVSHSAEQIMTQNMIMNGLRGGVLNYNTQMGASAAMLNISETQAMQKMRLSWATVGNVAAYELPLTSTVLLLLVLCLFPVISLLMVHLDFGLKVFKHYIYTLIWLGSWPILYAVLNMAVTFYLHQRSTGGNGFTLSNVNQLVLMHSDVAGIAKYLMGAIPFLSMGLVMGMATVFNRAADYVGHGRQDPSAGISEGNISLGNTNVNNAHANKLDTNFSYMHGMHTEQLANGAAATQSASGETLYDTSHAISRLSGTFHASTSLSEHYSKAAESAKMAALENREGYTQSIHVSSQRLASFGNSSAFHEAEGHNYAVNQSTSYDQAASNLHSMVKAVAERNHVSYSEAYQGLTELSQGSEAHAGLGRNFIMGAAGIDAGAKVFAGSRHSNSNHESTAYDKGNSLNVTSDESDQFRENWAKVSSYSDHQHMELNHAHNHTWLSQLSTDLRESRDKAHQASASLNDSARYSEMANFAKTHAASYTNDFTQGFVNWVQKIAPDRAETLLTNISSARIASERQALAERYINTQFAPHFEECYEAFQHQHGVQPLYHQATHAVEQESNGLQKYFDQKRQHVREKASAGHTHFESQKLQEIQKNVGEHQFEHETKINQNKVEQHNQEEAFKFSTKEKMDYLTQLSDRSPLGISAVKPKELDEKLK